MPPLTPQQRDAIGTHDVSIALAAGAGCGKTFVLTRRFLAHLEPGPRQDELSRLVAITFTERAAREMRDRIREECRRRVESCPEPAAAHWQTLLRDLDGARVSTIHSFCARLLRAHAVEAGVDPHFGLLEAATQSAFLRTSVHNAFRRQLAEGSSDAQELLLRYGLERGRSLLELLVRERFRIDFSRWSDVTPEALAKTWLSHWQSQTIPLLLTELVEDRGTRELLDFLSDLSTGNSVLAERRALLLAELPRLERANDPATALQAIREAARVQGAGGKQAVDSEATYEELKQRLESLRDKIKALLEKLELDDEHAELAASYGLTALRVARQAVQEYESRKREAGLLDFDDLLLVTRNLLRDHPHVRKQAAAGISLLMVDEFQDTDPVQADIVRDLCGERLAQGKLFMVGDAQQSIYRFRRADPGVFARLRAEIPLQGRLPLNVNFRSQPAILDFVNAVFAGMLGEDFTPLRPDAKQLSPEPSIEFLFVPPDPNSGRGDVEARRRIEADWIARRLRGLLDEGLPRVRARDGDGLSTLRAARRGDIVILFRSLTDIRLYEDALQRQGLDYYLVGGKAFYSQQEIYDLTNLCQCLNDPDDQVSLAGVLRSPFFGLTDDTLAVLCDTTGSLSKGLCVPPAAGLEPDQRWQVEYAAKVLKSLRDQKDRLPLARLLNQALDETGYDAALLTEFLGKRKLANLRKLIDLARQFDGAGLFTLADFATHLRESVAEQPDEQLAATHPESSDVIRLMSIHQAKGLEFPVVVLADMNRAGSPPPSDAAFDPELGPLVALPEWFGEKFRNLGRDIHQHQERAADDAERLRLLYVALTRAADHLILSAALDANKDSPWIQLLSSRFDLTTGGPRQHPRTGEPAVPEPFSACIPLVLVHDREPDIGRTPSAQPSRAIPLERFRESVEAADAETLPATLRSLAPDISRRSAFSVSQVELADALNAATHAPLRFAGPLPPRSSLAGNVAAGQAEQLGQLVHGALERLDFREAPNFPACLRETCSAADIDGEQPGLVDAARRLLERFWETPTRAELAAASACFRELEFLLRLPESIAGSGSNSRGAAGHPGAGTLVGDSLLITGKIDCLYQSAAGTWHVLDYKTSLLLGPERERDKLAEYELQLGIYALAVKDYLGTPPRSLAVLLLQHQMHLLSLEPDTPFLDQVAARLASACHGLRGRVAV